jgi:hypothetical protein
MRPLPLVSNGSTELFDDAENAASPGVPIVRSSLDETLAADDNER